MIDPSFIMSKMQPPQGRIGGNVKIVFWGLEKNCGIISNMLILAATLVYKKGYRVALFELAEERQGVKAYFQEPCEKYHKAYIETLIERQLYYISEKNWKRRQKKRKMRNGKVLKPSILRGICYVEQNMDVVFVNLGDRQDEEAKKVMWEADVLVVTIQQEEDAFETFFAQYTNLSEHMFFLIGNYCEGEMFQKSYFCSKYRISENEIGVIPFHSQWQYICEQKKVADYVRHSDEAKMSGKKYYFLKEAEQCIEKIWNMAE